jgi:hypothetical protein
MKKYFPSAMLLTLLACAVLAASAQRDWKEYVYAGDGFAISAPLQPAFAKETKDTGIGPVEAHNYTMDLGNETSVGINVTDFKIGQGIDAKLILEATKAGIAGSLNGKIVSEKEVSLGSAPGIQFDLETDANHMRFRYFFIEGKLFALISAAPRAKSFAPETDRIFNSFRLVTAGNK